MITIVFLSPGTDPPHPQPPQPEPVEGADWPAADKLAGLTLLSRLSETCVMFICQLSKCQIVPLLQYKTQHSKISSLLQKGGLFIRFR